METKASANHLTSVALLADGIRRTRLTVIDGSLEEIQEAVQLFGGEIGFTKITDETHSSSVQIFYHSQIGNCQLWIHLFTTKLAVMLQKDAFRADSSIFQKGTQLTIIDNQYLVLSDSNG
jgi:hypothetical protein